MILKKNLLILALGLSCLFALQAEASFKINSEVYQLIKNCLKALDGDKFSDKSFDKQCKFLEEFTYTLTKFSVEIDKREIKIHANSRNEFEHQNALCYADNSQHVFSKNNVMVLKKSKKGLIRGLNTLLYNTEKRLVALKILDEFYTSSLNDHIINQEVIKMMACCVIIGWRICLKKGSVLLSFGQYLPPTRFESERLFIKLKKEEFAIIQNIIKKSLLSKAPDSKISRISLPSLKGAFSNPKHATH